MKPLVVIAIGGNSLIRDKAHMRVSDQYDAICETVKHIVDIMDLGYRVVITHGNGPQVGFIMRRSEIAQEAAHMHPVPLVSCDADTQGAIGYQIQQALHNELHKRGRLDKTLTIITQVMVDEKDPSFLKPSKPIGQFYTKEEYATIRVNHPDWDMVEDSNRGYRRVVPSPKPIKIIEEDAIRALSDNNYAVIAVGGGGIPVIDCDGQLEGINCVIDKDYATALLAANMKADYFIISTAVDYVYLNYGKDNQQALKEITLGDLETYRLAGHFAAGSMLPKVSAMEQYIKSGGGHGIITSPATIKQALLGEMGSHITH